jgi:L-aspartate oxidase
MSTKQAEANLHINADIVIAGTGVGGLFAALNLPRDKKIVMITKSDLESSDSFLAQGGICMLKNDADYDSYFEDTLKAGHYENRRESVDIMIRSSQDIIKELISYGVDFERDSDGNLAYTREGAHSTPRILFHEDITGREITSKLLAQVKKLENVTIFEYTTMLDIIEENNTCFGLVCQKKDGDDVQLITISAPATIWASGGIGGLYTHSTNFRHLTGDALGISLKHNIELENIDYIQIHPTTLYSEKPGRRFLISESVRGEGAILLNDKKERFVEELLPRDVVAQAIYEQMEKDGKPYVWLSLENIDKDMIMNHFPNIYKHCLEEGYDITKECIPVVPAQHYFMGGVHVDKYSKTTMNQLYAVGEASCNGVHGANRLASNSLLESLVFAKRAACQITEQFEALENKPELAENVDLKYYENDEQLMADYKKDIFEEIEREKKLHEQYINEVKCR